MTYYGRWTYKYEIGAAKGAAGVLIVHETGPAGYPFKILQDSNTGEKFDLVTPDKNMGRAAIEGWMTLDQAKKLFQMAGQDFEALKKQAATREFKPVALGVTASMTIRNTLRTIESAERRGEARRRRPGAEGRVHRLHGALGPFRQERRGDFPRRAGQRVGNGGARRDGASAQEGVAGAEAIVSFSRR